MSAVERPRLAVEPRGGSAPGSTTGLIGSGADEGEEDDEAPGYEVVVRLVVEIMGRHSNIILVGGGGAIMDSIKRVPATVNRYRTVLPRRPYVPPPDQPKLDPRAVDAGWTRSLRARTPPASPLAPWHIR